MTSFEVVRYFKRNLKQDYGKIGHFGTLDPFASGVMLIAVAGASRLNDLVHEYLPKTYLAVGKLGVETETGDCTVAPKQIDEGFYLTSAIAQFDKDFIEKEIRAKFLGEYFQSPHSYSASKFEGKPLHEWAREGVLITKEKVRREIYGLDVIKYEFPYLSIRAEVSSGTFIRTLFSDIANHLGTIGTLVSLVRESIGNIHFKNALMKKDWPIKDSDFDIFCGLRPQEILPFSKVYFKPFEEKLFKNGVALEFSRIDKEVKSDLPSPYYWVMNEENILSLGKLEGNLLRPYINFASSSL